MILNLRDRAYVNKFAREVGELKNETVKAGNAYIYTMKPQLFHVTLCSQSSL